MGARGNQDKCATLTSTTNPLGFWVGVSAWFPIVCGIGFKVILFKSQCSGAQLLEDTKTYKQRTLEPKNNK